MRPLHVGCAALNQTPLDWDGNAERILRAIDQARQRGVEVLCLPELCITGYGCEDAFLASHLTETALEVLAEVAPAAHGMAVSLGLPLVFERALYNVACLVVDGRPLGFVAKQNLAGDGVHYEPRWFKSWSNGRVESIEVPDCGQLPLGDVVFAGDGVRIGFEICEDAWVAERSGGELAAVGVDLILNPSASHFALGKQDTRRRLAVEGSRAFGVAYLYANLVGNEAGRVIYDGGSIIASEGRRVAEAPRLRYADVQVLDAVVDLDANRMDQTRRASAGGTGDARLVRHDFSFRSADPAEVAPPLPTAEPADRQREFEDAVSLALFDYLRKSHAQGYVVSLSGGADSTAVSLLAARSITRALEELGADGVLQRLEHLDDAPASNDPRAWVRRLLTCVYQATRNSSETTLEAARGVAKSLGAEFHAFDVDQQVEDTIALGTRALGRELTWERDDLALQNIQARVRGPGVWLLANLKSALLLATSNRSEAAVGYASMDGDTCGGLSPIAGIDKAFLLDWLASVAKSNPAVATVTELEPSAELRPAAAGQTDEDDLMPYPLLEEIEEAAIGEQLSPLETFRSLRGTLDIDDLMLAGYVERFYRLWCRNQWKRERYAPSFHLDDRNLDPKTWCRFPILSGGFERELRQLTAYVEESKSAS